MVQGNRHVKGNLYNHRHLSHSTYSQACPWGHLYKAVACSKRSPFSCQIIENFIWIEPLL